jgi:hypothetical protein
MAIDNPQGASAITGAMNSMKKTAGENDWGVSVSNGQMVRYNKKTGQVSASPVPGYKAPNEDTTSQKDFQFWQGMPEGDAKNAFGKARNFIEAPEITSDPEVLRMRGEDFMLNGNNQALTNMNKKEANEALRLARETYKKNTGVDYDSSDLALRRGGYLELQAESRKFGQMLAPTQTAHDRLQADIQMAKEQVGKIQERLNTGPYKWNQFMQMTSKELQDAGYGDLAKAREAIYNVERGYSSVQANGMRGGDTVASQKRAESLINSAMTPDVLLGPADKNGNRKGGLLDFMGESSTRILDSVKGGQERLRQEWKKGAKTFAGTYDATAAAEDAEIEKRLKGATPGGNPPPGNAPAPQQQAPAQRQWTREELLAEQARRKRKTQ